MSRNARPSLRASARCGRPRSDDGRPTNKQGVKEMDKKSMIAGALVALGTFAAAAFGGPAAWMLAWGAVFALARKGVRA